MDMPLPPGAEDLAFHKPRLAPEPCHGCTYPSECYHNDDCPLDTPAEKEERQASYEAGLAILRKRQCVKGGR